MLNNETYAQVRFSVFCSEVDTLQNEIEKIIENDDLLDTEYAIMDGAIDNDRIGYETHRIRNEKTLAIWKLLQEFNPDIVPPMPSVEKKPAKNRIISADTARRYIQIYGGSSSWIRTDADDGYPVLIDDDGEIRAKIDLTGPMMPDNAIQRYAEIPF